MKRKLAKPEDECDGAYSVPGCVRTFAEVRAYAERNSPSVHRQRIHRARMSTAVQYVSLKYFAKLFKAFRAEEGRQSAMFLRLIVLCFDKVEPLKVRH